MDDQIKVRRNEHGEEFTAWVEGIACAGTGSTENAAIRSLANVLADFVKGHAGSIGHMRLKLRELAREALSAADPALQYEDSPVIGFPAPPKEKPAPRPPFFQSDDPTNRDS